MEFVLTEAEKRDLFALLDGPVIKPSKKSVEAVKKYREMIEKGQLTVCGYGYTSVGNAVRMDKKIE